MPRLLTLALLAIAFLLSCSGSNGSFTDDGGPPDLACADQDGDGQSICAGDCDDSDPNTYAGAPEACGDGRDNNCNATADEGCNGLGTYVSGAAGDDGNPGTQALPVRTIAKGMANAMTIGLPRTV